MTTVLHSIQWDGKTLLLLDQRLLPDQIVYLSIATPQEVWEAIRHLIVRGAPAIGISAAYGLYLGVRDFQPDRTLSIDQQIQALIGETKKTADYLASARPTAVNLFWALERLKKTAKDASESYRNLERIKEALLQEAVHIHEEDEETNRKIGEFALALFEDGMGILTHCNAGGLATARYGTALSPIYLAKERGISLQVFADETRPVLQGARLTAFELQQAGVDVTLICDNMAGMVMAKGWVQAVIVGTDRVAANGDIANKIGTYSVAVLAKAHNIPFYVACPISTIDMSTPSGDLIPIEERDESEITQSFGKRVAPIGVKVYNPAFDVTPGDLVTAIITERGIVRPPFSENLRKLIEGEFK